jgi:threonyl-tRNA synthetase
MVRVVVDGVSREVAAGTSVRELAPDGALVARINDELVDLARPLSEADAGAGIGFPPASSDQALHVLRHSAAHVLAQAVLRLHPGAKYAIGPAIENGFYYDFELDSPLSEDDLEAIEAEIAKVAGADQPFRREEVPREEAIKLFSDFDQPYKREILSSPDEEGQIKVGATATLYRNEDAFVDLCLGPHVPSTSDVRHVKLLRVSGAYWRGDEKRPQLQRVYGTAWPTRQELDEYLHRLEEAERRDHRKLGRDLDLFSFPSELGAGLVVWHPKGGMVRKLLEDFSRNIHLERGYEIVASPHIGKAALWETSGHLAKFAESMYPPVRAEEGDYYLKPMNCPFHVLIYRSRTRSYRDLPLRLSELGTVYRHERSGTLHGIFRPRGFTQDDSHIFCRPDQLVDEIRGVMDFVVDFYAVFGLKDAVVHLSTVDPAAAIGSSDMWSRAEQALRSALDGSPFTYDVQEGEGAFYGPKIDFDYRDAIGRLHQLTTIQCDFALPEQFGLEYIGEDNSAHRPVMVHRALYGSVERFFGVYLEHTAGALPPWLAPVQVRVVPIRDDIVDAARRLAERLRSEGLRADVDDASETMQYKVRRGAMEKIPWMLVIGPKEVESGTVSVRLRTGEDRRGVRPEDFITQAKDLVSSRALDVE